MAGPETWHGAEEGPRDAEEAVAFRKFGEDFEVPDVEEPDVALNDEELDWPVPDLPAALDEKPAFDSQQQSCRPAYDTLDPVYKALVDKIMSLGAQGRHEARLLFLNHDCPRIKRDMLAALDEASMEIQRLADGRPYMETYPPEAMKATMPPTERCLFSAHAASISTKVSSSGTIKKFFVGKGFGFVTPDDGGEDVFVHVKDNPDLVGCQAGDAVRFDLVWDNHKGNYKGTNLSGLLS